MSLWVRMEKSGTKNQDSSALPGEPPSERFRQQSPHDQAMVVLTNIAKADSR